MADTLYVITAYDFNHRARFGYQRPPLDPRFLYSQKNIKYFLIDREIPKPLRDKVVLQEEQIDQELARAGGKFLAEWSFLLAEARHGFCEYPFFTVSSRFYQKNVWLKNDLNEEWDSIFGYLRQYGWGYLPSYDRPLSWIDLAERPFPVTDQSLSLIQRLYGVQIPDEYRYLSDFQCNYIGFASRKHLLEYVEFYRPLFEILFDAHWNPRADFDQYVQYTTKYRREKPVTFLIEMLSHLFFYSKQQRFFGLHYDGYYEVDERGNRFAKISDLSVTQAKGRRLGPGTAQNPWFYRNRWSPMRLLFDGYLPGRLRRYHQYIKQLWK